MMRFIRKIHAFLGALLSLLFLVWFLSGFMMMFTSFPRLSGQDLEHKVVIRGEQLPSLERILSCLPEGEQLSSFTLTTRTGHPVLELRTPNGHYLLSADSLLVPVSNEVGRDWIMSYVQKWSESPIQGIDTLQTLDAWTPYASLKSELPIYRFRFADPDKTYLYISSVSGEPLQICTKTQRLKSSLGTIPHMLYFWQLRQNRDTWLHVVSILAGLGVLMTLTGIIVGVQVYLRVYKRKRHLRSPYRKKVYRWHHISGAIFGFFVLMFALSGLLSINDLPSWMVKQHNPRLRAEVRRKDKLDIRDFMKSDYRLLRSLGDLQQISFHQFGNTPYYNVVHGGRETTYRIDDTGHVEPLFLSENEIKERLSNYIDAPLRMELISEYDNYYSSTSGRSELPIYRVKADDPDQSLMYVSPTTGYTRYYNTSGKIKKWIYPAFHSLRFKYFVDRPIMRRLIMIILTFGGTIVSATGVWLGIKYYRRGFRRRISHRR